MEKVKIPDGFIQCKEPYTRYYIKTDGQQLIDGQTGKFINKHKAPQGYIMFNTIPRDDGKKTVPRMHRLIAINLIPVPEKYKDIPIEKLQVNHLDENPSNNSIDNLEWCTAKENMYYGTSIARSRRNLKVHRYIHQYDPVTGELVRTYKSIREPNAYGFKDDAVSRCCQGVYKQHHGYIFKYGDIIEKENKEIKDKK